MQFLPWAKNYNSDKFKSDLQAGITIGVMLIPQGMAYAIIAGLPSIYGLYAALIPPVIYAFFGSSYQLSIGPVATMSLLVFAGLSEMQLSGTSFILAASLLALLVGIIQLGFGLGRLGFIVNFLSRPVVSGYTSAAALIIGFSQIKNLLGLPGPTSSIIYELVPDLIRQSGNVNSYSLMIGIAGIVIMIAIRKLNRKIPGAIILVVISISFVALFSWQEKLDVLGVIPSGLPAFQVPELETSTIREFLPLALIISLVAFLESISISKALQTKQNDYSVNANTELIALGLANISAAFFKAFPVSGGFSRSAVNQQAGAKTPMSLIISSILIGITLLFLTPLFYYLPKSILAAIIMVAVVGLIDFYEAKSLWNVSKRDFWMMAVTFIATLAFGIQEGILTGIVLSLALVIYKSTYPHWAVLGKLPDTNYYRNIARFPEAKDRPDVLVYRFDSQLYFANIQYFVDSLCEAIKKKDPALKMVVINAQAINALDMSAVYGLKDLLISLKERNYTIYFTEVIGPVRDTMKKTGIYELIGKEHFHMRVHDAIKHFDNQSENAQPYALQSND